MTTQNATDITYDDTEPCGEGMCRCDCDEQHGPCGCDCPRDDYGQLLYRD